LRFPFCGLVSVFFIRAIRVIRGSSMTLKGGDAMSNDTMTIDQVASYLQRDAREVNKLASRGYLPGHKVGGAWRFHRAEINHWIETQMHAYTEEELTALETGGYSTEPDVLISNMLSVDCISVPLPATTRVSVLRELVKAAEQSWNVYDPAAIFEAVKQREDLASTALPSGVAIPHTHRPLPAILGEHVLAYGRTVNGIPFGGERGALTDIFFLVCCRDDRTHLQVLARLSRLMLRPGFVDDLRAAETPADTWKVIATAERDLVTD
jgi:PTS system nitrogen regulatory IIA component